MRRRTALILAVCLVALTVTSLLIWSQLNPQIPHSYEKNIDRNYDTQEEEKALITAENINCSAILSVERFQGSSNPQDYLNPGTYLTYTYANFIDKETVDYYQTRYDNLQGREHPKQIRMSYEANASKRSEFRIYNSPPPSGAAWYNTTVVMTAADGSVIIKDPIHIQFYYKNQSSYQNIDSGYDFNFTDCYVVKMELSYSEIYASVAGFYSVVDQIVVLNRDFEPVLFGLDVSKAIS